VEEQKKEMKPEVEIGQPLPTDLVKKMEQLSNTLIEQRKKIKAP
jgi:hypothetical protein